MEEGFSYHGRVGAGEVVGVGGGLGGGTRVGQDLKLQLTIAQG